MIYKLYPLIGKQVFYTDTKNLNTYSLFYTRSINIITGYKDSYLHYIAKTTSWQYCYAIEPMEFGL